MRTLVELFGGVFLFVCCGNGVPTSLILALHPWVAQICKADKLTFHNEYRNRRLSLSPRRRSRHWWQPIIYPKRWNCNWR